MTRYRLLIAIILVVLACAFRTIWHIGDNIELVTAATLASGAYLGLNYSLAVPLAIMIISDSIIGNTNIFLFTWSGYIIIGIMGYLGLKIQNSQPKADQPRAEKFKIRKIIKASSFAIIASLWFFLWTNFGVWLLDSWGMYSRDFSGLIDAYILGLPFFKYNLLGNLIFVPVTFIILEALPAIFKEFNLFSLKTVKLRT